MRISPSTDTCKKDRKMDFNLKKMTLTATACLAVALTAAPTTAQSSFTTLFGELPNEGLPTTLADPGELAVNVGEAPIAAALNGLEAFTSFSTQNLNEGLLGGTFNQGQNIFLQNANFYVGGGQIFPVQNGPDAPGGTPNAGVGPIAQQQISAQGQANLAGLGILDTDPTTAGLQTFNNRIFGVVGTGRSDISFTSGVVTSLFLQAGVTSEGLNVGGNPDFGQSLPEGSALSNGDGTLLVFTDLGLQATIDLEDSIGTLGSPDLDAINQDLTIALGDTLADGQVINGSSITRLSIINTSSALNSAAFLSELTVTTTAAVPEPSSFVLLGLGCLALLKRRRR